VGIVAPRSVTLDAPLVHLGSGDVGYSGPSRGVGATTIAAAGTLDLRALAGLCVISAGSEQGQGRAPESKAVLGDWQHEWRRAE
jgi:hypothetical protein